MMVRDPHRPGVEIEVIVERGRLAGAVFFAYGAATYGEYTTPWSRTRLKHAAVVADFAELVCGRHSGKSGPQNQDADT